MARDLTPEDRWENSEDSGHFFDGKHYLFHWCFTLFALLGSSSDGGGSSWFIFVGDGDAAALILLVMLIGLVCFMIFCMLPFIAVTLNNINTAFHSLLQPESIKDFLMALTALAVVSGVVVGCIYLFPVFAGAFVAYAVGHHLASGLGLAAAVVCTFLVAMLGVSTEMVFHSAVGSLCDVIARAFGFETPRNEIGTAILTPDGGFEKVAIQKVKGVSRTIVRTFLGIPTALRSLPATARSATASGQRGGQPAHERTAGFHHATSPEDFRVSSSHFPLGEDHPAGMPATPSAPPSVRPPIGGNRYGQFQSDAPPPTYQQSVADAEKIPVAPATPPVSK